jgi:hypothetical protein
MKRYKLSLVSLALAAVLSMRPRLPRPSRRTSGLRRAAAGRRVKGTVKGEASRSYRLVAGAGQTLHVELKASNGAHNFNIVSPGSKEALLMGAAARR